MINISRIAATFAVCIMAFPVSADRNRSWEEYGIEFAQDGASVVVDKVNPGSMADKIGFEEGDIVVGDWLNGFLGPDGARRIHRTMAKFLDDWEGKRDWRMDLHRPSVGAGLTIVLQFPPDTDQVVETVPLPPAMRHLVGDEEMVAIWNHEATVIDTPELADAAMRILFALSHHVAGCYGPDAVTIPIQIQSTTVTRDGFGIERGRDTDVFSKEIRVRPAFEALAVRSVQYFSDSTSNPRFIGVRDLISQDRCDGPRLRHLEEGLAKAAGITLPAAPFAAASNTYDDWRGFVAECTADLSLRLDNEGGAAEVCVIYEHIARGIGNDEIYADVRNSGMSESEDWPQDIKQRFMDDFDMIYRGERPEDVQSRIDTYMRDNGL